MLNRIDKSKKTKTDIKNKYAVLALLIIVFTVIACSSSKSSDVSDKKDDAGKEQNVEKPVTTKKGFSDEDIEGVFKAKQQVGKFKQVRILSSSDDSKKIFKNASGEALAMYMGNSKKEGVMYVLASYPSKDEAKEEFRNFIDREKEKGAKMLLDVTEDSANKSINANYKKGKVSIISFCSWMSPAATMCHSMASPDPAATVNFHDAWFGGK